MIGPMIVTHWAWYIQMISIYALRIVLEEVRWVYAGVVGWLSVDCKLAEMDCAICSQLDHDLNCLHMHQAIV
jgi:hypothetical protein